MASIYEQRENEQAARLVIEATVEECEQAWGHSRADFGYEGADDLAPVWITLGDSRCGVWIGDEEDAAILIDTPRNTAQQMAAGFGLLLPVGSGRLGDDLIAYQPFCGDLCDVV